MHEIRALLVDDEEDVRIGGAQALELAGFEVLDFESVEAARPHVAAGAALIVICDVRLPGTSGVAWQRELAALDPELPVILVTGHGDIAMAVQAMRDGAYDFIEKPYPSERLVAAARRAADKRALTLQVTQLRAQIEDWNGIQATLIGRSAQMQALRRTLRALADTSADVVVYGETGTGKELVAQCLHQYSPRRRANFVPINCGGLPEQLAESEIFGHEAGAFTGASRTRIGKFEHAHGGTLFLDEIESMPLGLQVKFLRALQERTIERVGSNKAIPVDCRIVAASKEDLKQLADRKMFRADLYYRIAVAFVELPALRERREDIPLLFDHFVLQAASRFQRPAPELTGSHLAELMAHPWPGNVRELRNVADRFVLGLLGEGLQLGGGEAPMPASLPEQVEQFERAVITETLRRHHGEITAAAKALQIPKQTLYDKMRRLKLSSEAFRDDG